MSILELAHLINGMTGNKAGIVYQPLPPDDPRVRQPDITRARKTLDWEPKMGLEEGLKLTISWFRQEMRR